MSKVVFRYEGPFVIPVGVTTPINGGFESYLRSRDIEWATDRVDNPAALAEFGGRICYGASSFANKRETPQSGYLRKSIIEHKHESVIEHVSVNFAVSGLARSTLIELSRHRVGVSMSVRSTRFTDDYFEFLIPASIRDDEEAVERFKELCYASVEVYNDQISRLEQRDMEDVESKTLQRKRLREAARNILPHALTSDLLLTLNARSIRHIVELRSNEHADMDFREFANALFYAADSVIPELLQGAKARLVGGLHEIVF